MMSTDQITVADITDMIADYIEVCNDDPSHPYAHIDIATMQHDATDIFITLRGKEGLSFRIAITKERP